MWLVWAILFTLVGMFIVFYPALYAFVMIPGLVEKLSNKPNVNRPKPTLELPDQKITKRNYEPSTFGFFTTIRPGQVKIIQQGKSFVRCILDYPGYKLKGELKTNGFVPYNEEYWEVIKTPEGQLDTHPIPFPIMKLAELPEKPQWLLYSPVSILWWMWKRWTYKRTGYVFTGIYPFRVVRVYPMERFDRITDGQGIVTLVRREDYSDHYRVAHSQFPTLVARADTSDNIPVNVLLNEVLQVFNPYQTSYNTDDDWPTRFLGSVSNRVTMFTRSRPLDQVWTAKSHDTVTSLADFVTRGGKHLTDEERQTQGGFPEGSTCLFGIRIIETQILDISPSNAENEKALGAEALAKVTRKANEELAKGQAAFLREEGAALKEHPYADIVVQTEGMVRAAEAVGKAGGTVFLNTGGQGGVDPIQVAILKELQELAKQRQQGAAK